MDKAANLQSGAARLFSVHGEPASAHPLADALRQQGLVTYLPELHESVEV